MGKPVERQNHSLSFFILAALIAITTAWAFYDEFVSRRPWKDYQDRIFGYERKEESGELKVTPDPSKPTETITVAEARKRLEEITTRLAPERDAMDKLAAELKEGKIQAEDAEFKVKYLKSEDDGLFYIFQH